MKRLIVATANEGKLREIREMLKPYFDAVLSMAEAGVDEEIVEDGTTFRENAVKKAEQIMRRAGEPVLADDSGIVVDALDGAPGVYSARFAGENATNEANNLLLLKRLEGVPGERRTARFVCALALALPDGRTITTEGLTEGRILFEEQGTNGFGYDPLFFSLDLNECFACVSMEQKNAVSHRGRALEALSERLKGLADGKL